MFRGKESTNRPRKIASILPFVLCLISCILIVAALATTGWFYHKLSDYGLFQRCWMADFHKRKCKNLSGGLAEKMASIGLLIALVVTFAASVITFLGMIEQKKRNFKIACGLCVLAAISIGAGAGTYGGLAVAYAGPKFGYSFYVAIAAILTSLATGFFELLAIRMSVPFEEKVKKMKSVESLTEITVVK